VDWLAHDEVDRSALPAWARADAPARDGKPYDVRVFGEGLVLSRGRRHSAVRWDEILVPVRLEDPRRLLVATPRRPPRAPWFELGGLDVSELDRAVHARLEAIDHRGYRQRRRAVEPMPIDQVLTAVLGRQPLPGAVEIPPAMPGVMKSGAIGATVGGGTLGFYGMLFGPTGMLAAAGVGAVGGGLLMGGIELARRRAAKRVLVLTPDGFVGGLDGNDVRAIPWDRIGRFAAGVDPLGNDALEVLDVDDRRLARVIARYFGSPLDVIVSVAEAYRRRAVGV